MSSAIPWRIMNSQETQCLYFMLLNRKEVLTWVWCGCKEAVTGCSHPGRGICGWYRLHILVLAKDQLSINNSSRTREGSCGSHTSEASSSITWRCLSHGSLFTGIHTLPTKKLMSRRVMWHAQHNSLVPELSLVGFFPYNLSTQKSTWDSASPPHAT